MKPLIGITPSILYDEQPHGTFARFALSDNYVNAVLAAGGIPVILPPQDENTSALLDTVDGVLLSGGADIDPKEFGDCDLHPKTYGISPLRDRFELDLVHEAIKRELPMLCICRGIQVLNVALGGTLYQDIADQYDAAVPHRQQEIDIPANEPSHEVTVTEQSLLGQVYQADRIQTNSFHHQAVKNVAPGLVAEAVSRDGLVEAVSLPGKTFVLGLQWHPEMMFETHEEHRQPFEQLVAAAKARQLLGAAN
jgi:putative glutamine amidotransferase